MLINTPQHITGLSHLLVKNNYLKNFRGKNRKNEGVLIIEARKDDSDELNEHEGFDPYIAALLMDLKDLETQVKTKLVRLIG